MTTEKDPAISALEAIHAALKPLDPETRRRILTSVGALLDIPDLTVGGEGQLNMEQPAERERPDMLRAGTRPVSLIELMQEKNPGTNAQRIATFAYHREKNEGQSRFGRGDLETYFSKAKLVPAANFGRDFAEAVRKGWIHEDGEASYITSKGLEAVEAGFAGERAYVRKKPKGKVKPRAKSTAKRKTPGKGPVKSITKQRKQR